jgi:Universal stress protein family
VSAATIPSTGTPAPGAEALDGSRLRPVLLATLAVPFDGEAAQVAMDAAAEGGVRLIVVDAVERPFWIHSAATGHAELEEDEDREQIRALVTRAVSLGLEVEHLRVRSPRPVDALLQVTGECGAGLLVFGPDRSRLRPRRFARIVRRIRRQASCLLWVAGEGP